MQTLDTWEALDVALQHPCTVLFVDVAWSGPAIRSRNVVLRLEETWQQRNNEEKVAFYRVDLSEQAGTVWDGLRAWLPTRHPLGNIGLYSGAGGVIWASHGRLLDAVVNAGAEGVQRLRLRTLEAVKQAVLPRANDPEEVQAG